MTRSRFLFTLCAAALLFAAVSPGVRAAEEWKDVERVVAIGDIHGDFNQFATLLRQAGLIDDKEDWSGGRTHLVQTGDVPDRGPDTRRILDLLMKLEKQARKQKGYVHALIGNHEAMNIYGDLRYVHPGEYESFRDRKSEKLREKMYKQHLDDLARSQPGNGEPTIDEAYKEKWFGERPLGYFEHRLAFATDGKYGRWIARRNVAVKVNDMLFLHGGISPKFVAMPLKDINRTARAELADFARLREGMVIDSEGPLWYRGLAERPEAEEEAHVEAVLQSFGVRRVVVGHTYTVTGGAVMPRFDAKVIIIDIGLSAAYGGRLACLVIENGKLFALHRGVKLPLPEDQAALLEYYKQAAALDPQPSPLEAKIKLMAENP